MSSVPQHLPGELRVRVGVLDRVAGHRPARPRRCGRRTRRARGRRTRAPRPTKPRCCSPVSRSRISGVVSRSAWRVYSKAHRPLSQFHSSLTAGSSPARRRSTPAAAMVGAQRAAGGAVLADAGRADQVERAGLEPVARAGERADRADLHDVDGEVGLERLVGVDRDLLERAALEQLDERVTGDLLARNGCSARTARSARGRAAPRWRSPSASRRCA